MQPVARNRPAAPLPRRVRAPGGFSLIEVLVVVAVIAVLVALLMPVLGRARGQARTVRCQANIRQIVTGWHQYLDAHRGHFPRGLSLALEYGGKVGTVGSKTTARPLNQYVGVPGVAQTGAGVFHCPGDTFAHGRMVTPTFFDYYGNSYKANRLLTGPGDAPISALDPCRDLFASMASYSSGSRAVPFTRNQVLAENRLLLIGDFGWEEAWNVASTDRIEWHGRPYTHNIGFMDGHVDTVPIIKGLHVTSTYTVIPFRHLLDDAARCQRAVPLPRK